ncbi:hypothetical protein GCM10009827_026700 [Dactylosporangium maewongense]|uniref:Uncharacterized protein n=1 Tax=Dactylosporangium maewongense TaxID=634393 RepID=A0ABN2A4D2_9ACTN
MGNSVVPEVSRTARPDCSPTAVRDPETATAEAGPPAGATVPAGETDGAGAQVGVGTVASGWLTGAPESHAARSATSTRDDNADRIMIC